MAKRSTDREPTESTKIRKATLKKLRIIAALKEVSLLQMLDDLIKPVYAEMIEDDGGDDEGSLPDGGRGLILP